MKGQGGPVTSVTEAANEIPLQRYLATPPTATDGQYVACQSDVNGNTKIREQYAPVAEDNVNGVIATRDLPVAASTYSWSVAQNSALAASLVIKATAGVIRSVSGRIDSTLASGTYYLLLMNAASLPANGAVTNLMAPQKYIHVNGTDDRFALDFTANGIFASVGAVLAISTTEFTLTVGTAVVSATACFK
jgi:hypothetical protein